MGRLRAVLPLLMIYYIVKKADKKYEKKIGWMKKISADFAIIDRIGFEHTIAGPYLELKEHIRGKYGEIPGFPGTNIQTRENAITTALTHTLVL